MQGTRRAALPQFFSFSWVSACLIPRSFLSPAFGFSNISSGVEHLAFANLPGTCYLVVSHLRSLAVSVTGLPVSCPRPFLPSDGPVYVWEGQETPHWRQ